MSAYEHRNEVLSILNADRASEKYPEYAQARVLVVGWKPFPNDKNEQEKIVGKRLDSKVDQSIVFCRTFKDLFLNRQFKGGSRAKRLLTVINPDQESHMSLIDRMGGWEKFIEKYKYDCVVFVRDHEKLNVNEIKAGSKNFVDARDHFFEVNPVNKESISMTASERLVENENADISVVAEYTGIVPIVYKAQRSLLQSLIESICLAFIMIAVVMMILLRDWKRKASLGNSLNVGGGMVSMLPNIFPIVIIFGAMGHLGVFVDIGSMMTASVAMGVAVDDTIHFLNWYRKGLYDGMDRKGAIMLAYKRVGTAMTQTSLIGGLGLAVFAFSTFTPTQRFGTMMLLLLFAALIGDLIFLPAILAGPLGKLFGVKAAKKSESGESSDADSNENDETPTGSTPNAKRSNGKPSAIKFSVPDST